MALKRGAQVEADGTRWPADGAYTVEGWAGIAFRVLGWELEPDEDTDWSGYYVRSGRVLVVMIGDDKRHRVDPDDTSPLSALEYCRDCGQVGCTSNVYE
jgi:hypothetical protein